jgi:hypothetical protein
LRRLNFTFTLLTVACATCIAGAQIVIPRDVLENRPPKKVKPKTPTTQPADKKPDIQRLIINFRQAAGSAEKREKTAAKLLEVGPKGASTLRRAVTAELPRRTAEYKKAFYNTARAVGAAKYRATGSARIKRWRAQFKATGDINKESLKSKAGPAMDSLLNALVPKREEVLEKGKLLTARREELIALDSILAKCDDVLKLKTDPSELSKTLKQQENLISLMCTPMSDAQRKPITQAMKHFARMEFEESHGFVHLNVIRILLGLRPMQIDLRLIAAGRDHSKDMQEHKFFAHKSPIEGKSTPWARAARQGTKANGECIAAGMGSGPGAIRCWFFSPGHHKIIMSGSSRVGLGKYARKWTLMTG